MAGKIAKSVRGYFFAAPCINSSRTFNRHLFLRGGLRLTSRLCCDVTTARSSARCESWGCAEWYETALTTQLGAALAVARNSCGWSTRLECASSVATASATSAVNSCPTSAWCVLSASDSCKRPLSSLQYKQVWPVWEMRMIMNNNESEFVCHEVAVISIVTDRAGVQHIGCRLSPRSRVQACG